MYRLKETIIEEYWLKKLSGELPEIALPLTDHAADLEKEKRAVLKLEVPAQLTDQLKKVAKNSDIGLFILFFSGLNIALHKYTAVEDVIVATLTPSTGGRDNRGLFCRNRIVPHFTVKEVITRAKKELVEAIDYAGFSLDGILEQLQAKNGENSLNILNTACIYQPFQERCRLLERFDLVFILSQCGEQLCLAVEYPLTSGSRLQAREITGKFSRNLLTALERMLANPDREVAALDIISPAEQRQLLHDFNDTKTAYPADKTIHRLFEEQVSETPDHTALVFEDKHLTYSRLNTGANQTAGALKKKGAARGTIVGLLVERSPAMVSGLLGILKTGAAYLPIDPAYPGERITYMLEESNTPLLLTAGEFTAEFKNSTAAYRTVNILDRSIYTGEDGANPANIVFAEDPAYVIYTSGSTGNPKGVMVEHRNVVNFAVGMNQKVAFSPGKSILALTTVSFDIFVLEVPLPLLKGLTIIAANEHQQTDPGLLAELIARSQVDMAQFTPSRLNLLLDGKDSFHCLTGINELMVGGEPFPPALFTVLKEAFPGKIYNLYGPTETTVWSTVKDLSGQDEITIGNPITNTRVYIVDNCDKLRPVGTTGELCIGGDGVSRGYLNNPELTAEKYTGVSFADGDRVYRTGDLARWLADSDIDCLGRIDHQVKIRGFRIELEEIETQILNYGGIKEAVVVAKTDEAGYKYLTAYFIPVKEVEIPGLSEFLAKRLPDYMVPSFFVPLEEIPLTPNGKVDRNALPELELSAGENYVAPRNRIEKKLAAIWSKVLAIEENIIGIDADFFQLGGHSLNAALMVSRIHREFNAKLTLGEVFKTPTLKGLAQYIKDAVEEEFISIRPVEKKDYYTLSSAQKRLYIVQQLEPGGTAYNMPQVIPLPGEPVRQKLEAAFAGLVKRHESLRTSFEIIAGEPVQRVYCYEDIEFRVQYSGPGRIDDFIRPFDLARAPLLRVALARSGKNTYTLLVDMHHIISDGISLQILAKDFSALYAGEELPPLPLRYKDYSQWQNSRKEQEVIKGQEAYWLKEFAGEMPVLSLPIDYPRPAVQDFEGRTIVFEIDKRSAAALRDIAHRQGVTLYMVLLAALNVLLARLSSREDIVVGTPAAGRRHVDLERIIGIFVNTLALRNYPVAGKSFDAFLQELKERSLEAFENQDYPFEDLVDKAAVKRDAGRNPLFDVVFVMQNMVADTNTGKEKGDAAAASPRRRYENRLAKFDMTITAAETGETLRFAFQYAAKLFKETTIQRFTAYFKKILSAATAGLSIRLGEIDILSEAEKRQVLYDFNDTEVHYPGDKTLHQLFAEQAEKNPDRIAVVGMRQGITYRELNKRAHQLARRLHRQGIGQDRLLGIMGEHSLEMIIGVLAILKAGGAYVPLPPEAPQSRIKYILDECNIKRLPAAGPLPGLGPLPGNFPVPRYPRSAVSLAYIIYTSGSTGKPKGVMVEHRNVVRLVKNSNFIDFAAGDRLLQTGALDFDASTFEIWGALLNGLTLYLAVKDQLLNPGTLKEIIARNHITIIWMTSPLFNRMAQADVEIFTGLRHLLVGGDVLSPFHINLVKKRFPRLNVINGYGPTENTTFSTTFLIDREYHESIPIGKPIANSTAYILNQGGKPQPIGVAGELYVGGDGVSRGYLNAPELTAEKYYYQLIGGNLYRTGDLARWRSDGNIDFSGRIDHQVKIRGFRIEPGEIESRLMSHTGIKDVVVTTRKDEEGTNYLCAYVVLDSTEPASSLNVMQLREFLSQKLPDYMIPAYFVSLEKMPLLPNGKIDRKSLPRDDGRRMESGTVYAAPRNQTEKKLAEIWAELLAIEKNTIGIDADFFELGGHSLKATLLMSRVHREFNVKLTLADIFTTPVIRGLAKYIEDAAVEEFSPIRQAEKKDYYPLSPGQKRLYILQQLGPQGTGYNMPQVVPLQTEPDPQALEAAFHGLVKRHESLRTSFETIEGEPVQRVRHYKDIQFEIQYCDPGRTDDFLRPFDFARAPLLRVRVNRMEKNTYLLMMDMHHIISDGISRQILVKDFSALYAGEELPLPALQYKDYSEWQEGVKNSEAHKRQEIYWLKVFERDVPALNLPVDFNRPETLSFEGRSVKFEISQEETKALNRLALAEKTTLFSLLLAIYNVFLAKISNREDIVVGVPIAGRRHTDLENIIGMFVNTLALRNYPEREKGFASFLKEVTGNTIAALENQDCQFEDLVELLALTRDAGRNPLFDAAFGFRKIDGHGEPAEIQEQEKTKKEPGSYKYEPGTSRFDLSLYGVETREHLVFTFEYSTKLFKKEKIERFIGYFKEIVSYVSINKNSRLTGIRISHDLLTTTKDFLQDDASYIEF